MSVNVISTSNAADLGYRALADVAVAADGLEHAEYRIVGGHMVQLLLHVYPTPAATERSTADADAGIGKTTAAGQALHRRLIGQGYEAVTGNQYVRQDGNGEPIQVDLLIPHGNARRTEMVNGRGFDAIPGLGFALNADFVPVQARVLLFAGDDLSFTVPVPDVEAALILKALAWQSRKLVKDLVDINSLLEIVQEHRQGLNRWGYAEPRLAGRGERKHAAAALHSIVALAGRNGIRPVKGLQSPARLAALIREHVPAPA